MSATCERCGSKALRFGRDAIGRTVETCERRGGGCGRVATISGRRPGDVLDALEMQHAAFCDATRAEARAWAEVKAPRQPWCPGVGRVADYEPAPGEGSGCYGDGARETPQKGRCLACSAERNRRAALARQVADKRRRPAPLVRPPSAVCACGKRFVIARLGIIPTTCRECARREDNVKKLDRWRSQQPGRAA